jgi:hypothetical protein
MTELSSDALEARLAPYRAAYVASVIPAVVIPGAITVETASLLRERLLEEGLCPYYLPHRGRYAVNDSFTEPDLWEQLETLASAMAGQPLSIFDARWSLLRRGDYALTRDDTAPLERHVELTLDVSPVPAPAPAPAPVSSAGGEVCYAHRGQLFFAAPQALGNLTLVERGPTIRRYERYLTHRAGDAEVIRLRLSLRPE